MVIYLAKVLINHLINRLLNSILSRVVIRVRKVDIPLDLKEAIQVRKGVILDHRAAISSHTHIWAKHRATIRQIKAILGPLEVLLRLVNSMEVPQ